MLKRTLQMLKNIKNFRRQGLEGEVNNMQLDQEDNQLSKLTNCGPYFNKRPLQDHHGGFRVHEFLFLYAFVLSRHLRSRHQVLILSSND